jgi:hypothetical protein
VALAVRSDNENVSRKEIFIQSGADSNFLLSNRQAGKEKFPSTKMKIPSRLHNFLLYHANGDECASENQLSQLILFIELLNYCLRHFRVAFGWMKLEVKESFRCHLHQFEWNVESQFSQHFLQNLLNDG